MLRHAGAVLGSLVMVGCGGGESAAVDAAPPADAAVDVTAAQEAALDRTIETAPASLNAQLVSDPVQVDFGVFYLGCPLASKRVLVTNLGPGTTGELKVTLDQPFRLGLDECTARALLVGEQCQIEVRIAPEEAGELKGAMQAWSSAADLVEIELEVVAADVAPAFELSPASLDFAPLAVGQSATRKVTISVPEGFRAVPKVTTTIGGPDFAIAHDGCAGQAIGPGKSCDLEIAFHPTSAGDKSAALSLSAPEPCPPFQSQVSLKGHGQ